MLRHTIYTMQEAKAKPCQSIPDYLRDNEIDFNNVRQALRWQPVFLLSSSKRKGPFVYSGAEKKERIYFYENFSRKFGTTNKVENQK